MADWGGEGGRAAESNGARALGRASAVVAPTGLPPRPPPAHLVHKHVLGGGGGGMCVRATCAGRGARGWTVRPPPSAPGTDAVVEGGLDELFDGSRAAGPVGRAYRASIDAAIDAHEASRAGRLGALLFEPVLQGAGGMRFIDPAWQVGGEGEGWRG